MLTMAELKSGEQGRVLSISKEQKAYRRKLLAMGLIPGTDFTVTRVAPLGDPVEIKLRGFSLSLRRQEAKVITVEKIDA